MLLYAITTIAVIELLAVAMAVSKRLRGFQLEARRKKIARGIAAASHLAFEVGCASAEFYLDAAYRCIYAAEAQSTAHNHARTRSLLDSGEENLNRATELLLGGTC